MPCELLLRFQERQALRGLGAAARQGRSARPRRPHPKGGPSQVGIGLQQTALGLSVQTTNQRIRADIYRRNPLLCLRPQTMCSSRRGGRDAAAATPSKAPPALTQHICRAVPRHEAGVIPVAHPFLEDALAEIFAEATAGCHQAVVTGVRLREAAQDCPGHQPAVREHREHGAGRPAADSQERGEPPAQPPPGLRAPAAGSQPSPARRPPRLGPRRPSSARPLARPPRRPPRPSGLAPALAPAAPHTPRAPALRAASPPRGGLRLLPPGRPAGAAPAKASGAARRAAPPAAGCPGQRRRCPLRRPRAPPAAATAAAILVARAEATALDTAGE